MICNKNFGVIFDLDGVIIDSAKVMEKAFEYSFKIFFPQEEPPFGEYAKHAGKGFLKIMEEMGLPPEMHTYFTKRSIELISEIIIFNGITDLLYALKENNCYIGLATGKDSFRVNLILKEKKLYHYFDKIICSDQVKLGKPSPDSINFHLQHSQIDKENLMFVGDSISDIQCAHNANVTSIAVLWGFGKREDLIHEKPDYFAYDVIDLEHIFYKKGFIKNKVCELKTECVK